MEEALKKVTKEASESIEKCVTLCLKSKCINLNGTWSWDMQSPAVYCSDVMSFPEDFIGTKGIIHPDDLAKITAAISLLEDKNLIRLDFRIITTYGEVKSISGQRVSVEQEKKGLIEPVPGKEPWQDVLDQMATQKENDFLHLRSQLTEYTERLHGIGSWILNKETGQGWYSDNVFRIYGLAPQSLNAHTNAFNHFIHKDDRIAVMEAFEKAYGDETPLHIEYRIVAADGETKYIQQITRWFFDVSGQLILAAILRDVTDERNILDELSSAQSNTLLHRHILKMSEHQSASGYWITNLATRKTLYSDNYYRIYGFKQVAVPNYNSFINFVHSDDRQRVRELVDKMFHEHVLHDTEFRIVRPDGKMRYLKQTGKVFITQNKELMMVGLVQDISVEKGLEKKILELNETIALNNLVAEMSESAAEVSSFVWLPDGYMQWSDGFYRFLGYKPGAIEALPRILYKNIHAADLKIFRDAENLLLNNQSHDDVSIRFISKGGIRKANISFRQVNYGKDATIALVHDVTKQTEAEQQFTHNKQYGELLTESVTDVVIFTNTDNTIIHWNKVAEEKTGISREDALYNNLFDVLPQLNDTDFLGQLHLAVRGTEFHADRVYNFYLRKAHDYWLWPLKDEGGEVLGVLHVVHDVSKQLELQQQLSERLNFIESLVESSVDRIVVLDHYMNYLYWNKKAEDYYAISKERVLGKNILEIFPSFRNDPSYQQFRTVLKGETVYLPPVDDNDEYFETYLIPVKNEAGEVTAVLWTVHDLTREYQLTKERTRTASLLQATMDASQEIIQVFEAVRDEDGQIVDFRYLLLNQEAEKWMPDAVGKTLLQLQRGVVEEGIFDTFKQVVETGISHHSERHYVHEQFNGWFYQSVVKLNDGVATTTRDITERKKAEQEVLRLKDEIAQQVTNKYATLFNSIDEGFSIIDLIHDDNGNLVDFIYSEINPAFIRHVGADLRGKRRSELYFDKKDFVLEKYDHLFKTGEPLHFEHHVQAQGDQWFQVSASRIGGEGSTQLGVVFRNITERKQQEQKQQYLLQLSDALRTLSDPDEILNEALRIVGEYLDLDRVVYNEINADVTEYWHRANYTRKGFASVVGRYSMGPFKETVRNLQKGITFIANDAYDDSFNEAEKEAHRRINVGAYVTVPLVKNGRWVCNLVAHYSKPRIWKKHEIAILEETAERIWAAVERAKAEDQLKHLASSLEHQVAERTKELQSQLALLNYTEYLAQSGTWEYEIETGNFKWSEGMYKMFGLPLQMKVQPETYLDFVIEEDRPIAKKIVSLLKKKHNPFEDILRIKRNNEIHTLKIKGSVIHDENKKPQKIVGVDVDITNVKKAEEKLKDSEHWLEQTAKASPDAIMVYDLKKKQPTLLNNCYADWIGICNKDFVAMGVEGRLKLVHSDDRLKLLHFNGKIAETDDGEVLMLEYRVYAEDGKILWIRNRSKVFQRDEHGNVTHMLSVLQNVTEEITLRDELKQRTQFAESLLDNSTNRITVFDRNYRFVIWNKRCEEIHGVARDKVIGKTIFEMFPGVEKHEVFMNAQERSLKGEYVHVPFVQDGYTCTYLEMFYVPLKNDAGETYAVLHMMHDVTKFVRNAEELDALNKQLEAKNTELEQKNEEITSFAFVASHDMKEPLRKIHTFSDWLMEQEQDRLSEKGQGMVEKINNSVHRMELLIEDILILTKIHSDSHKEENVNLDTLLKQVLDDMGEQIGKTSTIIHATKLPSITANSNQVFYLFKNLISNAIKFQKPGSVPQLTITSEIVKGSEVKANETGEYLKLSFADNGFGFDQRYSRKIFQVFQRLHGKHEYEGTGIGLAICRKIMENHNGMINVMSEEGKGSVFNCYFPLH